MTLGEIMRRWQERRTLRIMRAEHRATVANSSLVDVRQLHLETQIRDGKRNLENVRAQLEQEVRERDRDIRNLQQAYVEMEREMQHRLDAKDETIDSLRAAIDNEGSSECELPENILIGREIVDSLTKEINTRAGELKTELADCKEKVNAVYGFLERALEEDKEHRKAQEEYKKRQLDTFQSDAQAVQLEGPDQTEPETQVSLLQEELLRAKQELEETTDHARKEVEKCRENFRLRDMMHKMRLTDMGKKLLELDGRLKRVQEERDFFETQLRQAKGWSVSPDASFSKGNRELPVSRPVTMRTPFAIYEEGNPLPDRMMVNPMFACEAIKENVEARANGTRSASDAPLRRRKSEQVESRALDERKVKSDQTQSLTLIGPMKSAESSTNMGGRKVASRSSTINMEDDFWRFDSQELETPFNATQYPANIEKIMAKDYGTATKASSKKGSNEISERDFI